MSNDTASNSNPPGFFWLLTAFLGFAALAAVLNALFAGEREHPRDSVRAANTAATQKAQGENLAKIGLVPGKSEAALAKGLTAVQAAKAAPSTMLVPGSPTQLKQAAQQAAPAPAPAAPKPGEPAPAPAPATPPAK